MRGRLQLVMVALVTAALHVVAVPLPAHAVTLTPAGTVGGPLRAEMYPSGVAVGPDGSVVVADTGNNQVAKYAPDGRQVWRVGSFGAGVNQFENPRDVAVDDAGNVYVADARNNRVVKLSAARGDWMGAVAGYSTPLGVSVKGDRVYVADTSRGRVAVLNLALGPVRTIGSDGACALAHLRDAQADAAGNIYVTGYKTNQIFKLSSTGRCLLAWGSTGTQNGQMRTPYGVETGYDPVRRQELVYVAEGIGNRVQVFTTNGAFVAKFGSFGEPTVEGTITTNRRVAVARDRSGDAWIADLWGNRVERWRRTATGFTYAQTIGAVMPRPTSTSVFHEPRGMEFTQSGNLLVTDTVHHSVQEFTPSGGYVRTCGKRAAEGARLGQFNWPRGVAVDPVTGNLWTADTKQYQLQVLTSDCRGISYVKNAGVGADAKSFNWPYDLDIRASDRTAVVVDTYNHRLKAYDAATTTWPADGKGPLPLHVFGTLGSGLGGFRHPAAVTVGLDGMVYVADSGNNRVVKLAYQRSVGFTAVAAYGAGVGLRSPEGIAVDAAGRMYVADTGNDRVVVLTPSGAVDGSIAGLSRPSAAEIGPDGRLYVADTYADVVRVYTVAVD